MRTQAGEYEISYDNARILTEDKLYAEYFEHVVSELLGWLESLPETEGSAEEIWKKNKKKLSKLVSDWFINKLSDLMAKAKIEFIRTVLVGKPKFTNTNY